MRSLLLFILIASTAATHIIEGVPFVKQDSQYCGPASLSSILSFYGDTVDQKTIGQDTYCEKFKGALITDLENFARKRGFKTRSGRGTLEDIRSAVSGGTPVIVLVDRGFWMVSRTHYLVIFGYDDGGFIAHNGYRASQRFPYPEFQKLWTKAGSTYLLVYR
ncbi:MAG TPA: C39 family peptidase [Syntrophales bacterium]|nr:C39 family peptidase [Syntrophales bacterium]HPI56603.1 C39 family peptidase [Syntrophales bacterium]HPN24976.1 C39 family peptidase [Syntrophales bacterium]HQM29282.1 C39 family peptidase [Syntrophales bacterium]